MKKSSLLLGFAALVLTACKTPENISYFQDTAEGTTFPVAQDMDIRLQKGDKLTIVVHSRDPQLGAMFNLPIQSSTVGNTSFGTSGGQGMSSYTVAEDGTIDFPSIGTLQVAGLNRNQVVKLIKDRLIDEELVKDPVVTVEFVNMYFNVMGEVASPGRYAITKDKMTVLDALSMAGDLTIQGERRWVTVLRETPQGRKSYLMDMTQMRSLANSPAYYLQQNDVVYVDPSDFRKRETTVNGNNSRSTSFYFSLVSLACSLAVLIVSLLD